MRAADVLVALVRGAFATLALAGTQGIWRDGDLPGLVYFTNISNLSFAVVMVWAAVASLRGRGQPPAVLKVGVTLFLAITGLVSFLVLAPESPDAPVVAFGLTGGQIEHEWTPVLAFLDFLLLDAHRRLRLRAVGWWLVALLAYCAFTTTRGLLRPDLGYPYGFIDLGALGWDGLALNVLLYGVAFALLGLVLVLLDRVLPAHALVGTAGHEPARDGNGAGPDARGVADRS
ncbi:Pr6Pr family membrane protein [Cellulomonas sp. JZ18]|uniref:Pr6Pr family membrane protein n=1 Tax=Cellulomonas sp. JZ18 TaxID=2654191 RepID=UPI0018AFD59E|nr:Pr6Pr family membrane protein [Cellulomonas sp. JZ18]